MTEKILNTLFQFLGQSGSFEGLTFAGYYNMEYEHFSVMYKHFIETGENLLDVYSDCMHLRWDYDGQMEGHGGQIQVLCPDEYTRLVLGVKQLEKLRLIDSDEIYQVMGMAKIKLREYHLLAEREKKRKRTAK